MRHGSISDGLRAHTGTGPWGWGIAVTLVFAAAMTLALAPGPSRPAPTLLGSAPQRPAPLAVGSQALHLVAISDLTHRAPPRLEQAAQPDPLMAPPARALARAVTPETTPAPLRPRARPRSATSEREARLRPRARPVLRPVARPQISPLIAETPRGPQAQPSTLAVLSSLRPSLRPQTVTRLAAASPSLPHVALSDHGRCASALSAAIPSRTASAHRGSTVIAGLGDRSGSSRDAAITREVLSGNIPGHLRHLVPVAFSGRLSDGREAQVTLCVTPDYLAVGSDRDFVRVPLGRAAASQIAREFDMIVPTTRMVDAIYAQADTRLSPAPMAAGPRMSSTGYFARHNATIEAQRSRAGAALGQLVAGHKKDLVLTPRLASNAGRVAIYGWHRGPGDPIQPLSTVHGAGYADYSHGVRLVSRTAYLNGRPVAIEDLLSDATYASLISDEGAIPGRSIRLAMR